MFIKFILIFVFSFYSYGLFFIDASLGIGFGNAKITEYSTSTFTHDGTSVAYSMDIKTGMKFNYFYLGAMSSFGKTATKFTREEATISIFEEQRYDVTFQHLLFGAVIGLELPVLPLKLFLEYYIDPSLEVTYSENKSANVFGDEDELSGRGFGASLHYQTLPFIATYIQYRSLEMDKWKDRSAVVTRDLPDSNYSKLDLSTIIAGVSISFD